MKHSHVARARLRATGRRIQEQERRGGVCGAWRKEEGCAVRRDTQDGRTRAALHRPEAKDAHCARTHRHQLVEAVDRFEGFPALQGGVEAGLQGGPLGHRQPHATGRSGPGEPRRHLVLPPVPHHLGLPGGRRYARPLCQPAVVVVAVAVAETS
ncbi:uncharacterized protein ACA1_060570 [Acanthamoeba castellanii str. Neff]|uniref:Uncharacterized protein n=1 Tax=Acanthamoeba castellanii (strain ATCC 30010 / Neff) TaxID=1257118 RepID=L8GWF2_ACACF|nr:uncharacterized protein ACA1_060570 [Acanthamoeba castellanii str. Neff]ELR17330.1 hypothetical protein ACA1_060570 [Acanthamoeba castellanii str. Neff]